MTEKTPIRAGHPGRPRGVPKIQTTVRLKKSSVDWFMKHVPRETSLSAFIDEALDLLIRTRQKQRAR